ncbi:MAG TPA: hypothetical protein VHK69_07605, partial [Chitinophagaceae bacterium]|nr:hypothetical protein [Chitinophagaceae bacterium]
MQIRNALCSLLAVCLLLSSCTKDGIGNGDERFASSPSGGSSAPGGGNGGNPQPGVITAGEWNDALHWSFWDSLMQKEPFSALPVYWNMHLQNRVSVLVEGSNREPLANVPVQLKKNGQILYTARTDNKGLADLWPNLTGAGNTAGASGLSLEVNQGARVVAPVKLFAEGRNTVTLSGTAPQNRIEIAFIVDATGSMGDELE